VRRLALGFLVASLIVAAVACGGGSGSSNKTPQSTSSNPTPQTSPSPGTSTEAPTPGVTGTPPVSPLLDDVIDLAVQLNAMTREEATCVFSHPDILQEFLNATDLNQPGTVDEAKVRQEFHDIVAKYAVQLDRCFNGPGS